MEPVSAIGIVTGLVESLGDTLQVLQDFASEKIGSNFKEAEIAFSSSHSDLMIVQGNLHIHGCSHSTMTY